MGNIKLDALQLALSSSTGNEPAARIVERAAAYENYMLGKPGWHMPDELFAQLRAAAPHLEGKAIVFRDGGFETIPHTA